MALGDVTAGTSYNGTATLTASLVLNLTVGSWSIQANATVTASYTLSNAATLDAGTLAIADDLAGALDSAFSVNQGATLEIADLVYADIASLSDGALGGGSVVIGSADPSTVLDIGAIGGATTSFMAQ